MKKKNINIFFWVAIIIVAGFDVFSTTIIGLVPALGDILSGVSNMVWEIIELGLVFGLVKTSK